MPEKRKFMVYGDSNTYGYDPADDSENRYPEHLRWTDILQGFLGEGWEVVQKGMNGRRIPLFPRDREMILGLIRDLSGQDLFAVMLGTNDLLSSLEPDAGKAAERMDHFLSVLTGCLDPSRILVIAPPHIGSETAAADPLFRKYHTESIRMNDCFRELAGNYGTLFTDAGRWGIGLAADQIHFSESGHRRFAVSLCLFLGADPL